MRFKKKLENYFNEVLRTKPEPHAVGLGFAVGTGISILPTPGINILLGFLILLIFKKLNKYTLFGSILFWNILTLSPIYYLSYKIGDFIFGKTNIVTYDITLLDHIYSFTRRFLVGDLILAVVISCLSYFLVKYVYMIILKNKEIL
ncbi:DUF2062 domain-containing protein [Candidatus Woesearchaeota archaeon]|nr:DUF2062 domain-containing protein [Candidatus Woesearchaeota archaeon]